MLVLAWRAPLALRERVARVAEAAGCRAISLDDTTSWLGIDSPCAVHATGDALTVGWPDASIEAFITADRCVLHTTTPMQRALYVRSLGGGAFVASSSLPLLVKLFEPAVSVRGLAACLLTLGLPERIPYLGIERVSPQSDERIPADIDSLEPAVNALESAIASAVADITPGAGKVAVLLSGGLDSSAVLAALLEQKHASDIVPITWNLGTGGGDEPHLRAWEARLGRAVERVTVDEAAVLATDSFVLGAAPTALMTGAFERAAMRRAKACGASMLLTGVGGDEVFAGSLEAAVRSCASYTEMMRRALLAELPWGSSARSRLSELVLRPAVRPLLSRAWRERRFYVAARRERPDLGALPLALLRDAARMHVAAVGPVPRTATERYRDLVGRPFWLEMGELRAQLEAAEALPRFDVPLHPGIARVVASIAPDLLFDQARHRGLLRRVLQRRAPQVVGARFDKADFDDFGWSILRRANLAPRLRELAEGLALDRLGLVPARAVARTWGPRGELPSDLSSLLGAWPFLTAEAFAAAAA